MKTWPTLSAGLPTGEGNDASDPIILDMFQTHTINQSRTFGTLLLRELGAANHLKFATIQEAPFRVLKLPEVPSILIETAYISNAKEEKLLRSDRFQTRIAEGVARSVVEFLPALPATRVSVSVREEDGKPRDTSVGVVKGKAKSVADRKRDPISKSGATTAYRVKKGDTLAAIATMHGTTTRVLIDLNRLKRPDTLYVGRKLILPVPERPVQSKRWWQDDETVQIWLFSSVRLPVPCPETVRDGTRSGPRMRGTAS